MTITEVSERRRLRPISRYNSSIHFETLRKKHENPQSRTEIPGGYLPNASLELHPYTNLFGLF
jgi:hypothetical protein